MTVSPIESSAMARLSNANAPSAGGGMFIRPFAPPVSERHSIALFSMMNPNAIVTIAR